MPSWDSERLGGLGMRKLTTTITVLGVATTMVIAMQAVTSAAHHRQTAQAELAALTFPPYAAQRVIYHVTEGGGFFNRDFASRLGTLHNHVASVGAANIDLRVMLQGSGVHLLAAAKTDAALAAQVDALRADGVRFLVCRNSLLGQDLAPSDLYKVPTSDIVQAAVAEIAALEARGYVYIRL